MATFLAICQEVCDSIGVDRPTAIVGSTGDTEKRLLACANEGGEELMRRQDWTALQKEHTFTTTSSDAEYDLPSDFDRFIQHTAWDRDMYWRMRESMTPADWQTSRSGIVHPVGLQKGFRVKKASAANGRSFYIDPTPTDSTTDLVFEYISNGWCASSGGTAQSAWAADTNVNVLDARLLKMDLAWRIRRSLGLTYQDEADAFERAADLYYARDGGAPRAYMGKPDYEYPINIPDSGYGS